MKNLDRRLDLRAVVAISLSSMLGSGIFVLPGLAVSLTGPSAWMAYLLSAMVLTPAVLSKAELATAMPTSGGTYVYLERTFGPLIGTIAGLGLWLSLLFKTSFALVGIGTYLVVFADFSVNVVVGVLLTAILALNIIGIGKVGGAVVVLVAISIGGLVAINLGGFTVLDVKNFEPLLLDGWTGLASATGLVFVSYAGVTKVAAVAEEVIQPEKNLSRGILVSLTIITVIYCVTAFVLSGVVPQVMLAGDLKPIYTLAVSVGGHYMGYFAAILATITLASMANSGILAASRFPFAMSRDDLLPGFIGKINPRYLTPVVSILLSGVVVAVTVFSLPVEKIAKYASVFLIVIYFSENLAVMVLRETRVSWYKPGYRAPFYPMMQILGGIACLFLLVGMREVLLTAFLLVSVPGVLLYFFYSRHRTSRLGVVGMRGRRRDLVEVTGVESEPESDLHDATVLVALFGQESSPEMLVELGVAMAHGGNLEVLKLIEVPEQTNIHDLWDLPPRVKSLRRRIKAMAEAQSVDIDFDHGYSHDIYKSLSEITSRVHCVWLVKEWGGKSQGGITVHNQIGWLEDHVTCHIATFRDAGVRYFRRILVYLELDKPNDLVIESADHLAKVHQATINFVGYLGEKANPVMAERLDDYLQFVVDRVESQAVFNILGGESREDALVAASIEHDLLLLRSTRGRTSWGRLFGTGQDRLIEKAACSVVSLKAYVDLSDPTNNIV